MILVKNAIRIHTILIEKFGGEPGIRDQGLLESALFRPYQTFNKKQLYKTPVEKAAALIESIIINHPFLDGNKRFGYVIMRLTLLETGSDIEATENEKYQFVISIARGDIKYKEICIWIKSKLTRRT
jgi:death on curing protein